jgi:hypothetical protein
MYSRPTISIEVSFVCGQAYRGVLAAIGDRHFEHWFGSCMDMTNYVFDNRSF